PLGFGVWQLAAAAITGFIAKENVVGTLAVVYSITNFIDTDELALVGGASDVASIMGLSAVSALAYLMFNLFTPPCFAAIGAMNAELESKKWLGGAIAFQLGMGYTVAFITYQVGTLITTGALGSGFLPGLIAVMAMIGFVVYLMRKGSQKPTVDKTLNV
ncbi:MAG: feoB, partial [Clostridia bacterium]|nr:feoB [Clostridia bacterium]